MIAGLALAACGGEGDGDDAKDTAATADGTMDAGDGTVDAGGDAAPSDGTDGGASDGASDGDGGGSGLTVTTSSLHFSQDFRGVWGSNGDDIWWVGAQGTILHDNGKTLAPRASGTTKDLYAVWGRAADDIFVVGDGVILHWNGTKIVNRTPAGMDGVVFRAVHGPADGSTVLVAGDQGVIFRLHKDNWVQETTGTGMKLYALRALTASNVWALGEGGQGLRLQGGTWNPFTMPGTTEPLWGLDAAKSGELVACGGEGFVAATADKTWAATLSNDPKSRDLYAIWAVSDSHAFAVGKDGALIERKGNKWGVRDIDGTYMKTKTFRGLWGRMAKDGALAAVAVGDDGAGLRYDGAKDQWLDQRAETVTHLLSVRRLADGRLVAVGGGGLLLTAADAAAPFVSLGVDVTGVDLEDACDDGAGGLWAVGAAGVVVHVQASGDATVSTPAATIGLHLRGVAMVGGAPIVVGHGGVVARWTSGGWQAESPGVQFDLESVASAGKIAYAIGGFGTLLRRDAAGAWSVEAAPTTVPLHRVVAWGDEQAAAVGDNGTILLRTAAGWQLAFEQPGLFLYGVDHTSDGRVVAVGWNGGVVVGKDAVGSDGAGFAVRPAGVPNVFRALAVTAGGAIVVGHKGGIYRITGGL